MPGSIPPPTISTAERLPECLAPFAEGARWPPQAGIAVVTEQERTLSARAGCWAWSRGTGYSRDIARSGRLETPAVLASRGVRGVLTDAFPRRPTYGAPPRPGAPANGSWAAVRADQHWACGPYRAFWVRCYCEAGLKIPAKSGATNPGSTDQPVDPGLDLSA